MSQSVQPHVNTSVETLQFDMLTVAKAQLPGCESLQKLFVSLLGSTQQCRRLIPQRCVLDIQHTNEKTHKTPPF